MCKGTQERHVEEKQLLSRYFFTDACSSQMIILFFLGVDRRMNHFFVVCLLYTRQNARYLFAK